MNTTPMKILAAFIILSLGASCVCADSDRAIPSVIVRIAASKANTLSYFVDGKMCAAPGGEIHKELLSTLGRLYRGSDDDRVVSVIFDSAIPMTKAAEVRAVALKVGFQKVRLLVADPDSKIFTEILVGGSFKVAYSDSAGSRLVPEKQQ
jgi:hypothetical protein